AVARFGLRPGLLLVGGEEGRPTQGGTGQQADRYLSHHGVSFGRQPQNSNPRCRRSSRSSPTRPSGATFQPAPTTKPSTLWSSSATTCSGFFPALPTKLSCRAAPARLLLAQTVIGGPVGRSASFGV